MALIIDKTSYRSPNYGRRTQAIKALVLHSGDGTKASDLAELTKADSDPVSAHYYIDRQGHCYELVDPANEAWHAGISEYLGLSNWNAFSVGVELEHRKDVDHDYPQAQRDTLKELCLLLIGKYKIEQRLIVPHKWIAPARRVDPRDWENSDLVQWISNLYLDRDRQLWGTLPYYANYRIPRAWKQHQDALGKAVENAVEVGVKTVQYFERGIVVYDKTTNQTSVYIVAERLTL